MLVVAAERRGEQMSAHRFLAGFTAMVMAAVTVVAMPPPARAGDTWTSLPCVKSGDGPDCPPVASLGNGRKWRVAIIMFSLPEPAATPGVFEGIAEGLSAIGSPDGDPASPAWRELALSWFTAVAKRVAPATPTFVAAVVEPADEAVTAGLTGVGLAVVAALEWLVAAELDPEKANWCRAAAMQRFEEIRAAMLAMAQ
jgi:hypothetical protein